MVTVNFNNFHQIGRELEAIENVVTLGMKCGRSVDFTAYQSTVVFLRKILVQLFLVATEV